MQHLDEGTIHSWLDGALSPEDSARVEAHVKECAQCTAAVAEARGFIAAASRILTALDNAPRGVIPAATTARKRNWTAWRAAAAVLVMAVGSLVVLRTQGEKSYTLFEPAAKNPVSQAAPPVVIGDNSTAGAATPQAIADVSTQEHAALTSKSTTTTSAGAVSANQATRNPVVVAEKGGERRARENVARDQGKAAAVEGAVAGVGASRAPALQAPALARSMAMDAAAEPELLKVVGTPRRIGAKVTLYEVTPGDTVTLTESVPTVLQEVVTSAAAAAPQAAKRMAAQSPARAEPAAPPREDKERAANVPASAAAVPAPLPSPPAAFGMVSAVNTISWKDPATGAMLTLSGRLPTARLQEIRFRIERERAATAAAKKNP